MYLKDKIKELNFEEAVVFVNLIKVDMRKPEHGYCHNITKGMLDNVRYIFICELWCQTALEKNEICACNFLFQENETCLVNSFPKFMLDKARQISNKVHIAWNDADCYILLARLYSGVGTLSQEEDFQFEIFDRKITQLDRQ